MKGMIACFGIAFVLFGVIGFINGRSAVTGPDYFEDQIVRHLEFVVKPEDEKTAWQGELVYRVDGDVLYRFDVETNSLTMTTSHARLELEEGFETAGGWHVRPIFVPCPRRVAAWACEWVTSFHSGR
ncbi:MAG: hypothetical protein KDA69_19265 [Planctomycetaceae bacterium]|nr:hypothetical protein [Planctomycetaceae bacterium]